MKSYLIVAITCPDRPGIVEQITEVVAGFDGNWEESRLARLGGDFAGIVKVSAPQEKAKPLADALKALTNNEMSVVVKSTRLGEPDPRKDHSLCELRLVGADHEGIVHKVASHLARQGINVEQMETEVVPAPISASPLFHMEARIDVPPSVSIADLKSQLSRIGEELGVDIELAP
jgi:glycine cleavage system regulatory protein